MKQHHQKTNNLFFTICLLLVNLNIFAQGFERLYVNMPDDLNPILSKQNRLELLEYYKAHQVDSIKNRFKHKVVLIKFDSIQQHLIVKNTNSTTFEMKVLKQADSTAIIGIIRTVCGPVCQSRIDFYDYTWHSVALQFQMPKTMDWINKSSLTEASIDSMWVKQILENSYISLSFDGKTQNLIANCNSLDFLAEADKKELSSYIKQSPIVLELIKNKWIKRE